MRATTWNNLLYFVFHVMNIYIAIVHFEDGDSIYLRKLVITQLITIQKSYCFRRIFIESFYVQNAGVSVRSPCAMHP
jgi:hypothetical protein